MITIYIKAVMHPVLCHYTVNQFRIVYFMYYLVFLNRFLYHIKNQFLFSLGL